MESGEVRIFLGSHVTAQDARAITEQLRWCDVFIPELLGWTDATAEAYNLVSSGQLDVRALLSICSESFDEFTLAQILLISNSDKHIAFADVPDSHLLAGEIQEASDLLEQLQGTPRPWGETIIELAPAFARFARLNSGREAFMVNQLCMLADGHPGRRILCRLGLAHTSVVRGLRTRGIRVQSVLQQPVPRFGLEVQPYRYAQYGRPIPEAVLAWCLLAELLERFWLPPGRCLDRNHQKKIIGRVARTFSVNQVEELWNVFSQSQLTRELMEQRVREHGFVLQVRRQA